MKKKTPRKTHDCRFEEKISDMSGDIKSILTEFKNMNGSLRDTKRDFEKHEKYSTRFRTKVNVLWYGAIVLGWGTAIYLKVYYGS